MRAWCLAGFVVAVMSVEARGEVTWHNRVSRIVQSKCQECHRAGETAPFELRTYSDFKSRLKTIRRVVEKGVMPPWFAEGPMGHWENDRRLTDEEKTDLMKWMDAGAPEGDSKDAPPPVQWAQGWRIGKPDVIIESPKSYKIPAEGVLPYKDVLVRTNLQEDVWVQAVEVRPSAPQVVHHVLVFAVYPIGHPRFAEQPDYRGGLGGYFAGMVPGQWVSVFPQGTAKFLPKGASLVFQIHYTPNGKATEDRPKIGLVLARGKPKHEVMTKAAANGRFEIPPGAPNHEVTATYRFRVPARITSFMPHSHVRGKAYKYELIKPDGSSEVVLDVPRYDFNWQFEYRLSKPLDVAAGSRLKVTAWYDNSPENPSNPDPKQRVRFGNQTWDEMMIGYFTAHPLPSAPAQAAAE